MLPAVGINQNRILHSSQGCFSLVKSSHVADSLSRCGWSCTEESVGVEEEGRTFFFPTTCHPDILEIIYGLEDTKHIPKSPKSSLKRAS